MQGTDYLAKPNIDAYMTYTNTTEKAIREGNPVIYDPNMRIPFEGLGDVERVYRENGRLEYDKPIDLRKVADDTFVKKAIAILGPAGK